MKQTMKLYKYLLLLLWTLLCQRVDAVVEIRSVQYTTNNGLPNNSVRCACQDSKGFIWFGTLNGLSRYDGNSFHNYYSLPNDSLSLADHRIRDIEEDENGFLWILMIPEQVSCYDLRHDCFVDFTGCGDYRERFRGWTRLSNGDVWLWHKSNGCRRIRYENGKFSSYVLSEQNGRIPSNHVNFVSEDYLGRVWIGTDKGVSLLAGGQAELSIKASRAMAACSFGDKVIFVFSSGLLFVKEEGSPMREVKELSRLGNLTVGGWVTLDEDLLLFTSRGTYQLNSKTLAVTPCTLLNIKGGRASADNKGNYWVSNFTGKVWYINRSTRKVKEFQLTPADKVRHIDQERYDVVHDSHDVIWISTYGNGLFAYDLFSDQLYHYTADAPNGGHIHSNYLLGLLEDRSHGIWVCSEFAGLSQLEVQSQKSARVYLETNTASDRSNFVRMISRMPNGDICVGTRSGGLYTYDSRMNKKGENRYFDTNIYAMAEDADGVCWLGSRGNGLLIGDTWHKHPKKDFPLSNNQIFSIYRDRKNRMWVGTFGGGLNLVQKQDDGYKFDYFFRETYAQSQIRVINEDTDGWMWVGTSDGICLFQPDSLITNPKNYLELNTRNGKLLNNEVKSLTLDRKGRMWVGTAGGGVSMFEPAVKDHDFSGRRFTTEDGLVNNGVMSIVEDRYGKMWIATEYGVSRLNPDNNSFQNFLFASHGLGNVYSENSGCLCDDGRIVFGSHSGLLVFDPDDLRSETNTGDQRVVFTNMKVNGADLRPGTADSPLNLSIAYTDMVHLSHDQNSFTVDFSIFEYSIDRNTRYMYKLDDYDEKWSVPSTLNFASYKNLDPGTYTLHVKARNGTGEWCPQESTLRIVIAPPFWKTVPAYLIYLLLILLLAYILFLLARNFNQLRNRIAVEKQLTEYKLVFFTNISHEFRTPLTLIQGALERIDSYQSMPRELANSVRVMEKSTRRMLRLINQLLEFRKMQHNKLTLSLEETEVIGFLYDIYLNFKDVAESKEMGFDFVSSVDSYRMFIDRGNVDKVVYNLLSNAFKYTPSHGNIRFAVEVDVDGGHLVIRISDNGVGIPKEKQGELFKRFVQSSFSGNSMGIGLHLSYELVNLHKGNLSYVENEGGGSVFTVTLPLGADAYAPGDFLVMSRLLRKNEKEFVEERKDVPVLSRTAEQPADEKPLNNRKILIIEDDNDVRLFLAEEVGRYFEVETAADGTSGLEKAQDYDADLIICDVLMPGMNGFEVVRKLKDDFNTSHIPVILLTALDSSDKRLQGIESGADAYITKPFSPKYLITYVYKLIEQRDKLREKFSNDPTLQRMPLSTSEKDQRFADELLTLVERNLSNADFSIDDIMETMGMKRTAFFRKVRGVTGCAPKEYVRLIRLKKAAALLDEGKYNVSEVSYRVGLSDPFYFSKVFKQQFGMSPSAYQQRGDVNGSDRKTGGDYSDS